MPLLPVIGVLWPRKQAQREHKQINNKHASGEERHGKMSFSHRTFKPLRERRPPQAAHVPAHCDSHPKLILQLLGIPSRSSTATVCRSSFIGGLVLAKGFLIETADYEL